MKIINTIGVDGFRVGETIVKNYVNTDNTVCSAFQRMFSTDKSKLLITNGEMPFFSVFIFVYYYYFNKILIFLE